MTRPGYKRILPAGAKKATADLHDVDTVAALLKEHNVEVVISTVPHTPGGYAVQPALGDAAKKAGVKLFAPSEFGMPTDGHMKPGLLGSKNLLVGERGPSKLIFVPSLNFFFSARISEIPRPTHYQILREYASTIISSSSPSFVFLDRSLDRLASGDLGNSR